MLFAAMIGAVVGAVVGRFEGGGPWSSNHLERALNTELSEHLRILILQDKSLLLLLRYFNTAP